MASLENDELQALRAEVNKLSKNVLELGRRFDEQYQTLATRQSSIEESIPQCVAAARANHSDQDSSDCHDASSGIPPRSPLEGDAKTVEKRLAEVEALLARTILGGIRRQHLLSEMEQRMASFEVMKESQSPPGSPIKLNVASIQPEAAPQADLAESRSGRPSFAPGPGSDFNIQQTLRPVPKALATSSMLATSLTAVASPLATALSVKTVPFHAAMPPSQNTDAYLFRGDPGWPPKAWAPGCATPQENFDAEVQRQESCVPRHSIERRKCAVCADLCTREARFVRIMYSRTPVCSEVCWRAWLTTVMNGDSPPPQDLLGQDTIHFDGA